MEVEGFDLRGDLVDVPHSEDTSPAEDSQEQDDWGDGVLDEHVRIAVDSLLDDNMPVAAATSKKRTRAAASRDESAGPASVKRSRSQSGGVGVSSRRPTKPRRTVPTVVIPDSDDVFAVEDDGDGKHEIFDMTENDNLFEESKVAKEDTSTKLCKFECIICLDAASTLTVTHCGTSLVIMILRCAFANDFYQATCFAARACTRPCMPR